MTTTDIKTDFPRPPLGPPDIDGAPHNVSPLQRHNVIQADQFCPCGYNLHGQRVERDERLGFEIVRCPECGQYQPAGHGSTAMRPWLSRLAAGLLVLWILFLLGVTAAAVGTFTAMSFAGVEMQTQWVQFDGRTGRPVDHIWNPDSGAYVYTYLDTGETYSNPDEIRMETRYLPRNHPWAVAWRENNNRGASGPPPLAYVLFYAALGAIAFCLGVGQSAALWHVRGWRQGLPMAVVLLLPLGFLLVSITGQNGYTGAAGLVLKIGVGHLALAGLCYAAGLITGRPIARFIASLLVPPRPRQSLAFLWHADGKSPPSVHNPAST